MDFTDRSWRVIYFRGCEDKYKGTDGINVDMQIHETSTQLVYGNKLTEGFGFQFMSNAMLEAIV